MESPVQLSSGCWLRGARPKAPRGVLGTGQDLQHLQGSPEPFPEVGGCSQRALGGWEGAQQGPGCCPRVLLSMEDNRQGFQQGAGNTHKYSPLLLESRHFPFLRNCFLSSSLIFLSAPWGKIKIEDIDISNSGKRGFCDHLWV